MEKYLCIENEIFLSRNYNFSNFKNTSFYTNQEDNRFFWIQAACHIKNINGAYKIGLWFKENFIRQVQIFCVSDDVKNEKDRERIHEDIINSYLKKIDIGASKIENYWDKRDNYSTIIIDFDL